MTTIPDHLPDWIRQHIELYLTDPEAAHSWDSTPAGGPGPVPTLLLITRGRKSGEQKMLPLIYGKVADDYVIVASKGGAPAHPAWYLNLAAEPDCEIRVGAQHLHVRARDAVGEERESLWRRLAKIYPPYDDYQARTGGREIPVVVLEPRRLP